jgi:hypothetical protein
MPLVARVFAVVFACKNTCDASSRLFWCNVRFVACLPSFGWGIRHEPSIHKTIAAMDSWIALVSSIEHGTDRCFKRIAFERKLAFKGKRGITHELHRYRDFVLRILVRRECI